MNNIYLFWDLLQNTFNSVIQLLAFLKIKFKWVLDDSKAKSKCTRKNRGNEISIGCHRLQYGIIIIIWRTLKI